MVGGCAGILMIDSGSCLNLVGEQFVRDVLRIKSENISPTQIKIKGISGNTVPAVGEVKLNISIVGQSFDIIFIVIQNAVFTADLLLSYWGLVYCNIVIDFGIKIIKLDNASIPFRLTHSDGGLNQASLMHNSCEKEKSNNSERECKNVCTQSHEQICKQVSDQCMQVNDKGKNSNNERECEKACTHSHEQICKQVSDQCMQVDDKGKNSNNERECEKACTHVSK